MSDPSFFYSDGEFLTPAQLARKRQSAQALTDAGTSTAPINSTMEGFARLAQAGIGALQQRQLNDQISNNGMTDGAARRGILGGAFGLAGAGQPDTPLRAFGRSVFGGPLGSAPTGLPAPNYPAPPPQNPQNSMQPMQALGQPSIPATPQQVSTPQPVAGAPMTNNVGPVLQGAATPGVAPTVGDDSANMKNPMAQNPAWMSADGMQSQSEPSATAGDAIRNAFAKIFGPPA